MTGHQTNHKIGNVFDTFCSPFCECTLKGGGVNPYVTGYLTVNGVCVEAMCSLPRLQRK